MNIKAKTNLEKEILEGIQAHGYHQYMNQLRHCIDRRAGEGKASPKAQEKWDALSENILHGQNKFPVSISIYDQILH